MVRISRNKEMINIDAEMPKIIDYLSLRSDVTAAYLFGSYGTDYQTPLSDVDIAVLFKNRPDAETVLEIASEVCHIAGEDDINVIVLNTAPITLQFEIVLKGTILFSKGTFLEDFHEYLFKRYGDYIIDLEHFYKEYDEALREVYGDGE